MDTALTDIFTQVVTFATTTQEEEQVMRSLHLAIGAVVFTLIVIFAWMLYRRWKRQQVKDSFSMLDGELRAFDQLKKKGMLTEEEYRKVARKMSEKLIEEQQDSSQEKLSGEQLLQILAKDAEKSRASQSGKRVSKGST